MGDAGGGGAGGGINVRTRLFGTLAVKTGLASPKQVEECIAEQNAARAEGRTPPRLGEIMAQKGYLSREQVQAILRGDFAEPGKRFGELCIGMQFCTLEQVTQCLAEQQKLRDEGAVQRIGTVLVKHGHLRAAQIPAVLAAQNIEIAECGKCRISYNVAINSPESALKCVRCGRDLVMVVGFEEIDASPVEDIKTVPRGTPIPLPQAGVVPAEPLPPETLTASASSIIVEEEEVSLDELMGSDSPGVAAVEEAKVEEVPEQVAVEEAQEVEVAEAEEAEAAKEAEEVEEAEDAEEAAPIEAAPSVEPLSEAPEEIPEEAEAPVYGDYRVLQKIGQDAAGALFQAEHVGTGEVVALKIIELERTRDRGFFDRFVEDAKKAAALKHPALKRIISAGRAEGRLFYVSDFVSGKSLRLFLEGAPGAPTKPGARRRMSIRAASRIVRTVAEGLAYAHERGVFHGDIRPSNILIMPDGRVILSETGVPKNVRANAERLVQMHGVTPFYLAPELAMPDGVADARTDIYELGATFYHMVTGQPPFTGNSPLQIFMRMAEEEALPADTVVADFPRAISDLISDMMSPEPGDRFQTMDEVVSALERASDVTSGRSGTTGLSYPKVEAVPEGVPGRPVPLSGQAAIAMIKAAAHPKVGAAGAARPRKGGTRVRIAPPRKAAGRSTPAPRRQASSREGRGAPPPREGGGSWGLIAFLLFIVAAGVAGYFIWQKRKQMDKEEAKQEAKQEATAPAQPTVPATRPPATPPPTRPAAADTPRPKPPAPRPKQKKAKKEEEKVAPTHSLFGPGGTIQRTHAPGGD